MPTVITEGAMAARGFGFGAGSAAANYIEDVFSTYLYTGNGSTQTITNGIDLAGKGGLVWGKPRNQLSDHFWVDTVRGANNWIRSNTTNAQAARATVSAFGTTGFTVDAAGGYTNDSGINYVGWTFRNQPKFFDIVTYTGTGANRTIAHNLGSTPGCIIVKRTDTAGYNWQVYHNSLTSAAYSILLNSGGAQTSTPTIWNSTAPTSSVFSVGTDAQVNASGGAYVAYIYASNAGGFGAAGTDNVITCGSFVASGGVDTITLGYEPQWLLYKSSTGLTNWFIYDNMRGWSVSGNTASLRANLTDAEQYAVNFGNPTATGFQTVAAALLTGETYIYIAIRRGPMKTPTDATKVFSPNAVNVPQGTQITSGFPVSMTMATYLSGQGTRVEDRLRGISTSLSNLTTEYYLSTPSTAAEANSVGFTYGWNNTGFLMNAGYANSSNVFWSFQRAPGFFDEVCYTGTGANTTQTHNLGVVPELIIVKGRSGATAWQVYSSLLANTEYLVLNTTAAKATGATRWNSTTPTSTVFSLGTATEVNTSAATYVAYLFATVAGVSKVGSYSGTGATQTVNCGFTGGARFVLIKRTDTTGDWYVWDTARGMVAGTDPSILLNSTAAEVNANSVYTATTGFQIVSTAAGINANGGTYIFWAVA